MVEEGNLFQHATNPTGFRGEQQSCLKLVFTNEEDMIDKIGELPPIGKSDHVCQIWEMTVRELMFRNTTVLRRNLKRENWVNIKRDLQELAREPGGSPNDMNERLVAVINDTKAKDVPLCRPRSTKYRLPWMKNAGIKA